jgi:ABC-type multidrug transport system fused ATPase/permease subunit
MKTLRQQWTDFRNTVFDPVNLSLLVALVVLFYLSPSTENGVLASLIFVLITFLAAFLGSRATQQWAAANEEGVIKARGRLSVRSLTLLLRNIAAFEGRIKSFRNAQEHIEKHPEVTKRNYEEALLICAQLEEQTVSSIENWTDILSSDDIKTQIGVISELREKLEVTEQDLVTAKVAHERDNGKSAEISKRLREKIEVIEADLETQKRELREKTFGFASLTLGRTDPKLNDILRYEGAGGVGVLTAATKAAAKTAPFVIAERLKDLK